MKNNRRVLMYHSVGISKTDEAGARLYCVSAEQFREQMEYLAGVMKKGQSPSGTVPSFRDSPCLLTFDDGLLDNYTIAFPTLKEFGLKAYFFVTVSKINSIGYMNWEQLKELKNAGMNIGSHGMSHRILTTLKDKEIKYELMKSKDILEKNIGKPIDSFSIPKGHYNRRIIEEINEVGYKKVFTSNVEDNNGFKFGRIAVKSDWSIEYFKRVLSNGLPVKEKYKESIKNLAKNILGIKRYDKIRKRVLKK